MTKQSAAILASVLAIVHIVLACIYSGSTPYRTAGMLLSQRDPTTGAYQRVPDIGAPDERQHANYAMKLVRGEGFPVLDPKDPELIENYQAHQPPLYYLIEAGWVKLLGVDLQSPSAGFQARFPNALIGALTVLGTFFLGLWAFQRSDVGLVAASFVALLPMNAALSGALSNDPLLYCLCTWSLANIAKGCVEGWCMGIALRVGLMVGLAILTKTTAIALLPILLICLFIGPNRPGLKHVAVCALVLALVAAPWLVRNQSLYGDPLAISAFNEAFKNSPSKDLITGIAELQNPGKDPNLAYWTDWVGWWTARSFFGVFGYMDVFLNERGTSATGPSAPNSLYRMLLAMGVLTMIIWLLALRNPEWSVHRRMHWLLGIFLAVVVLLFLRFNAQYFQGQARYLFPAIGVIGIGVAIALLHLVRGKWMAAIAVLGFVLGTINVYALARLPSEFARRTTFVMSVLQTDLDRSDVLVGNDAKDARV